MKIYYKHFLAATYFTLVYVFTIFCNKKNKNKIKIMEFHYCSEMGFTVVMQNIISYFFDFGVKFDPDKHHYISDV